MKLIAAEDRKGGIGRNGKLLAHLPSDMKFFKNTTTGGTVIMGRKTLESFPGGRPLPDRKNVVISTTLPERTDCVVCRTVAEALQAVQDDDPDRTFVIGGGEIYRQMLPYCGEVLITEIDAVFEADTFLPVFSEEANWELVSAGVPIEENGISYRFAVYRRTEA